MDPNHHLLYADVCGTGETGNARFYSNLPIQSPNQIDMIDLSGSLTSALQRNNNQLPRAFPHFEHLSSPRNPITTLFQSLEPRFPLGPPNSQLGLVLHQQQLDRERQEQQQQQQQQYLQQQQHMNQPEQQQGSSISALMRRPCPSHKAVRPEFADYETRLRSFDDPRWPRDTSPVKAEDLAEAGFWYFGVYQGYPDAVECFFCGKGVCRWDPGDDAWSEHRRVSPSCLFVHDLNNRIKRGEVRTSQPPRIVNEDTEASSQQQRPEVRIEMTQEMSSDAEVDVKSQVNSSQSSSQCSSVCTSDDEGYSSQNSQDDRLRCKVCLQQELAVTFLPCAHFCVCVDCALHMKKCPCCRQPIASSIRIYF